MTVLLRLLRIRLAEDLIAAVDLYKDDYSMDRHAFVRLLMRKGFGTLGISAEDIAAAPERLGRRTASAATESGE